MKKLILVLALALVFSCSKDSPETSGDTETADLSQMIPNNTLEQSSEGMYYGVFGNSELKYLHGKILINAGNDGNYSATIKMVNGDKINFIGNSLNKTNIHFASTRGSFDFNTLNFTSPKATNVFIDNEAESYIVAKKSNTRGGGAVILGTYEETGNEANFFGNWDMFGDGLPGPTGLSDSEFLVQVAVSHKGTRGPFVDTTMEEEDYCIGSFFPFVFVTSESITDVWADDQTSIFAGQTASWSVKSIVGFHGDTANPYSPQDDCVPASFGTWSWAGRIGTMLIISTPEPFTEEGTTRIIDSPYNR